LPFFYDLLVQSTFHPEAQVYWVSQIHPLAIKALALTAHSFPPALKATEAKERTNWGGKDRGFLEILKRF
jgi:hypothetical protein